MKNIERKDQKEFDLSIIKKKVKDWEILENFILTNFDSVSIDISWFAV